MSDFLMRLAARELGEVPVLAPRVRSLYEGERGVLAEPDRSTSPDPRLEPGLRRTIRPAPEPHAAPPISSDPRPASVEVEQRPVEASAPAPLVSEKKVHSDPIARARELPILAEPRATAEERAATPPRGELLTAIPIRARDSASPSSIAAAERAVPVREPIARLERVQAQSALGPSRERAPKLVPAVVRRFDDPIASVPRRPARAPAPGPLATEPPIHVSIGRIEVTAVSSAPRAKEKSKPRPRASLDEYLSERRRGPR
jgi:hypothetical protein